MKVTFKNMPNFTMPNTVVKMLSEILEVQPNGYMKIYLDNPDYTPELGGVRPHYMYVTKTDNEVEIEEFGNLTYILNQASEYELVICDKWDFINDIGLVEMYCRFNISTQDGIEALLLNTKNFGNYYKLEYWPTPTVTVFSTSEVA